MSISNLPQVKNLLLTIPIPHVLLITINRPKNFNSLNPETNWEMHRVVDWAEENDSIWCIIITGKGDKAFCAGFDLVSGHQHREENKANNTVGGEKVPSGFGGVSLRKQARKPVISAVNGYSLGGGTEICLASDIVVATERSKFGLPEVKQGLTAASGGVMRICRSLPYQVAAELLLTGRFFDAQEAYSYGLVNKVIPNNADVVEAALDYAKIITQNSPDAVMLTKQGLLLALERASVTDATDEWLASEEADAWRAGENMTIGLRAFANKQKPQYQNPAKIVKKGISKL
ncbi:ClpP/crotonase-like domain-containing protein [Halteromyces radiatus]|uniref:ClpP/crotonase-like domain-containing protein n=1 Tax=Halteromyces radiatus TaxID=101107 RepID=UPI00221EC492|nr:ClpP/crotonase-like domain-containing protein [Halteromyces radiatus]KAI8096166.1 ClpP/crotonase-like domain-containing protein [Halteromyces radiatus]